MKHHTSEFGARQHTERSERPIPPKEEIYLVKKWSEEDERSTHTHTHTRCAFIITYCVVLVVSQTEFRNSTKTKNKNWLRNRKVITTTTTKIECSRCVDKLRARHTSICLFDNNNNNNYHSNFRFVIIIISFLFWFHVTRKSSRKTEIRREQSVCVSVWDTLWARASVCAYGILCAINNTIINQ